jgi:hypothetical protein
VPHENEIVLLVVKDAPLLGLLSEGGGGTVTGAVMVRLRAAL